MGKIWKSKSTTLHPLVEDYTVGIDHILDKKILPFDVEASIAHTKGLEKIGILTSEETKQIEIAFKELLADFEKGKFIIKLEDEDCHTAIENYMVEKIGNLGKKIHTGRSRNDQVLVATRLFTKAELKEVSVELINLQKVFLDIAKKYEFLPMPGYTHTRRAMPSSIGHWAGAYTEELINNHMLLETAYKLNDQNPLGAAAGFGVPLDLQREYTTELMGFAKTQVNTLYAVNSRGLTESHILSVLSQIMMTMGRLANEMIWFTTPEYNYFTLLPEYTTGSSIMPQKRNPDVFEIVRGNVNVVISLQSQVRDICKGLISGYNRDTQLTKEPLVKALDIVKKTLKVMAVVMSDTKPNKEVLQNSYTPELFAVHETIKYVKEGMSFRDAYQEVKENLDKLDVSDPTEAIKSVKSLGGPGNLTLDKYKISIQL